MLNTDADPRVYFAAERTFLAWLRTGFTVMAFGFVVARFGLFLRLLRAEQGVSRRELADALGVHCQTIGYLERGEYNPSLHLALRIAEFFGVPVEVIFSTKPFPRLSDHRHSA